VLAPLVVICLVAFTPENTLTIPTTSFSLRWFRAIFEHPDFIDLLRQQPLAGDASSATFRSLLAVPAALAIAQYDFPGRNALNALFLSPLIIPHLVLGVAFLRLFALIGATGSFAWLVACHVDGDHTLCAAPRPGRFTGLDRSAEHAAMHAGGLALDGVPPRYRADDVPGITGGWLLAFINSFDELTMSIFVTSPQTVTLPVRMYMYASESIDPMMAAVSALMILVATVTMIIIDRMFGLDRLLVGKG
jgi:putative spermidine/putrescine transport system permease protein